MGTLAALKTRIASELDRTDMTTQIGYAVTDAIKLYQARRFRFNQARDSFSTVASTEFYDDTIIPDDIIEVDSVRLTVNGRNVVLDAWSYGQMEGIASTTTSLGQPVAWAWYANQIRLYPTPNAVHTVMVSYLQRLPEPADDAENAWTDEAEALIRHAAKRIVWSDVIQDQAAAGISLQSEVLEYRRLSKEAAKLQTGGLSGCM